MFNLLGEPVDKKVFIETDRKYAVHPEPGLYAELEHLLGEGRFIFGFGSGLSPKAPGTMGTLVGMLIYLPLSHLPFWWYLDVTVAAIVVILVWEHRLIRPADLSRIGMAFFNMNAVISVVYFTTVLVALGAKRLWP